ncbi:MAG: ZIP family zinc transporter [Chloroflexota bacterium]|nr:ZIP family zinc transporter [Chloroflexota bacterium]
MPAWLQAGLWGWTAGAALLLGAGFGFFARVPQRAIATTMAFGSGVLISVLSFDLMETAYERGGAAATAIGFLIGAILFSAANWMLAQRGALYRKSSQEQQPSEAEEAGSGMAIAVGTLLDGIPESIAIGITLLDGHSVSLVTVIGVMLSNIPEGLSSSAGMRRAGRTARYVFGVWASIALVSGLAALVGFSVFGQFSNGVIAATTAIAAGAILAMLADTMIPEAFAETQTFTGLITVVGFLVAFTLSHYT